jgi:hypothetical protein
MTSSIGRHIEDFNADQLERDIHTSEHSSAADAVFDYRYLECHRFLIVR